MQTATRLNVKVCISVFTTICHLGYRKNIFYCPLKVFQNGRPVTSACEDITPRNLYIHNILII